MDDQVRYERSAARALELLASHLKVCGAVKGREIAPGTDEFEGERPGYPYDSPPAMLSLFETVRTWIARAERDYVRSLRAGGWTWQQIGDEYGVSRQSAYERWQDIDDVDDEPSLVPYLVRTGRARPAD